MNKLFCCIAIVTMFASCSKKSDPVIPTPEPPVVEKPVPAPYAIKEDFELGSKAAYAIGDVTLKTGSWSFDDALLGSTTGDVKNDIQSVRLRTGQIAMNFDIDSLKMLKINHAQYGNDDASEFTLWASTDQGRSYAQVGTTIANNSKTFVTDSFTFDGKQKIRFQIRNSSSDKKRINIDDIYFIGAGDPNLTLNSAPDTDPADPGTGTGGNDDPGRDGPTGDLSDAPPTAGDNSNLLFGNPSNATADVVMNNNYLIDQKYYVESYSSTRGTPNWVSWHLDETSVGGSGRQDNFNAFNGLPSSFYSVVNTSYSGSGFDRGHNCPSADRTSSVTANSTTFLMTNMIPQAADNNQHTWANLETYLRDEMEKGNEVYIIMGSYGKGGIGKNGSKETIDNGNVTVPSNVWKVAVIMTRGNGDLARINANTKIIAVNTPNMQGIDGDWTKYLTSVDAIEAATGYDLLSALPVALQTTIEAKIYTP